MNIGDKVEVIGEDTKGVITDICEDGKLTITDENGFEWIVSSEHVRIQRDQNRLVAAYTQGTVRKGEIITKHKSEKQQAAIEVDLHAEKLIRNTHGMQPIDIKNYQLQVVRKTMSQYRKQKGRKIVFIHGKGDGILKGEIERLLKKEYSSCDSRTAKYAKYGIDGAIEVVIR